MTKVKLITQTLTLVFVVAEKAPSVDMVGSKSFTHAAADLQCESCNTKKEMLP